MNKKPYDVTGGIIAFENGELDLPQVVTLFEALFRTGLIYQLQGSYQRTAQQLINDGLLSI